MSNWSDVSNVTSKMVLYCNFEESRWIVLVNNHKSNFSTLIPQYFRLRFSFSRGCLRCRAVNQSNLKIKFFREDGVFFKEKIVLKLFSWHHVLVKQICKSLIFVMDNYVKLLQQNPKKKWRLFSHLNVYMNLFDYNKIGLDKYNFCKSADMCV